MAEISLAAVASVYPYKAIPVGLVGSLTKPQATVTLKVYANDSQVTLNKLQYSFDGVTFENMSLIAPPDLSDIHGTVDGVTLTLVWDIYSDVENDYFNIPVYIKAQITDGVDPSIENTVSFTMEKTVNDLSRKDPEIPVGTIGNLEKQKLPGTK
jgi:hypothetical protein